MNLKDAGQRIWRRKGLVFLTTFLTAVLLFDLAIIQSVEYKAGTKLLIIQKQSSNLTKILEQGIYSDIFFEKVVNSAYDVAASDFSRETGERRKEWRKRVKISTKEDLGLMEINVFYPERNKAEQISRAIVSTLKANHQLYHGLSDDIEIRTLDYTWADSSPATDQLYSATALGALLGFLIGLGLTLRRID